MLCMAATSLYAQIEMNSAGNVNVGSGSPSSSYKFKVSGSTYSTFGVSRSGRFNGTLLCCPGTPPTTLEVYSGKDEHSTYSSYALKVYGNMLTTNVPMIYSDKRLKKDFKVIEKPSELLSQISGQTYSYKSYEELVSTDIKAMRKSKMDTLFDDEGKMILVDERERKYNFDKRMNYGLVAQEVQKVLPELVAYDSLDDIYSVNYIGFIPILIEAVKEQQTKIAQLEKLLKEKDKSAQRNTEDGVANDLQTEVYLSQNTPNPFSNTTEISCYIPSSVQQADFYLYDMQGTQLKKVAISDRAETSVTINGGSLKAGIYLYTLITDGVAADTKKMILTK